MIGVIDYDLGNTGSVLAAISKIGGEPILTSNYHELTACSHLILPGVGAFPDGMKNLRERNLIKILKSLVLERGVPILGICLGFQLLAESSTEFECTEGLGFIQGEVIPLSDQNKDLAIPHVGWNDLFICDENRIFSDLSVDPLFYYCHSYHMRCKNKIDVIGITEYGEMITAAVASRNIFGVQFHPEKSQENGLKVLRNFINI